MNLLDYLDGPAPGAGSGDLDLSGLVTQKAEQYGVPAALALAVMNQESGGRAGLVSPKGARGPMQLMPGTARDLGVQNIDDPEQNIDGGVRYLKRLLDEFGDVKLAAAAYHAGPGAVRKAGGVPDTNDGLIKTGAYADSIISRARKLGLEGGDAQAAAPKKTALDWLDDGEAPASAPAVTNPNALNSALDAAFKEVGEPQGFMARQATSFAKGSGSLVKGIGWLVGSDTIQGLGENAEKYWSDLQRKDPETARQLRSVEDAKGFTDTLAALKDNPRALADFIVSSVPAMVPGMGGSAVVGEVAGKIAFNSAMKAGAARGMAEEAARLAATKAAEKAALAAGTAANMGSEGITEAGSSGADTERFLLERGVAPEAAAKIARETALKVGAATTLLAGVGAGFETKAVLGRLPGGGVAGFAKNVGKEAAEEGLQNPAQEYFEVQGRREADPTQEFDPGKSVALGLATGGVMGAGIHGAGRAATMLAGEQPAVQAKPTDEENAAAFKSGLDAVSSAGSVDEAIAAATAAAAVPVNIDLGQTAEQLTKEQQIRSIVGTEAMRGWLSTLDPALRQEVLGTANTALSQGASSALRAQSIEQLYRQLEAGGVFSTNEQSRGKPIPQADEAMKAGATPTAADQFLRNKEMVAELTRSPEWEGLLARVDDATRSSLMATLDSVNNPRLPAKYRNTLAGTVIDFARNAGVYTGPRQLPAPGAMVADASGNVGTSTGFDLQAEADRRAQLSAQREREALGLTDRGVQAAIQRNAQQPLIQEPQRQIEMRRAPALPAPDPRVYVDSAGNAGSQAAVAQQAADNQRAVAKAMEQKKADGLADRGVQAAIARNEQGKAWREKTAKAYYAVKVHSPKLINEVLRAETPEAAAEVVRSMADAKRGSPKLLDALHQSLTGQSLQQYQQAQEMQTVEIPPDAVRREGVDANNRSRLESAYIAELERGRRAREFELAEQQRREADIPKMERERGEQVAAQADAVTRAQGFDQPQPTAMEMALRKAEERKKPDQEAPKPVEAAPEPEPAKAEEDAPTPQPEKSTITHDVKPEKPAEPEQPKAEPKKAEKGGIKPTNSLGRDSSWVIKNKATGEVIMETFDKKKVDALNTEKYEAVPIQEHLASLGEEKPKKEIPLSVGRTPNAAEQITVKDGVVYIGKYAAQSFETGEDVTVPDGATPAQIRDALIEAGAVGKGQKVFGAGDAAPQTAAKFFQQGDFPQPEPFKTKTDANMFREKNKVDGVAVEKDGGWLFDPAPRALTAEEKAEAAADIKELNKVLRAQGMKPVVPLSSIPTANHALAKQLGTVFGAKVQFVSNNPGFEGVTYKGVAYLTENLKRPELAIAGHEVYHTLEQSAPDMAEQLLEHVRGYLQENVLSDRKTREELVSGGEVSEKTAASEVMADINGAMWLDPKFWREMRERDDSLFRRVAYLFMEAMAKAVNSLTGTRFDVAALVTDVDAVRSLVAQTWADYNQGRDNSKASEEVQFSRAEPVRPGDVFKTPDGRAATVMRTLPGGRAEIRLQKAGTQMLRVGEFKVNDLKEWDRIGRAEYNDGMYTTPESLLERAASDDAPQFSRLALGELNADQAAAAERVLGKPKTLKDRAQELRQNIGKNLVQGIFDQFAPIREIDEKAYILSRMSKGGDSTLEAMMIYGKPFVDADGFYDVDYSQAKGKAGFATIMAPLQGEQDRFFLWVAAQRAERLKAIGLENLFSDKDIAALKTLADGKMENGGSRKEAYAKALMGLNEFNDAVLKIAVDSGLIDEDTRKMYKDTPYVPFYRLQEEGVTGFGMKAGLVNQTAWKKLKGGTDKLNEDLLTNTLQNWSHLISAAAKNRAAKAALEAATRAGVAEEVPNGTPGKGLVSFREGGKDRTFMVSDPYVMDAVGALEYSGLGPWAKPLTKMKHILTIGVTANPTFKIRNLMRDSIQAIGTSDLSYNPLENMKSGWLATAEDSETRAKMLASGGMIRFGSMLEGATADRARNMIHKFADGDVMLKDENAVKKFWRKTVNPALEAYQELGDRGEQVNRAALYEQLRKKGMGHGEASFWARDLMDFSSAGKWQAVRFLTQVVPFMNARLQGLYKLGRSGMEDYKRFGAVTGAVALASIALMLAYSDDDDWKKREDWDRQNYWWFKVGDTAFRIPKPFELGAIGTIAEMGVSMFSDDEMTGKRFMSNLGDIVGNQLSMNPIPQLVKPLLDVYANKDGFTKRPIESMAMQRLRPEDRYNERTSEVALFLGSLGLPDPVMLMMGNYDPLSPVKVDALVRGYFSWMGVMTTTALDYGIRPMLDRGERPAMQLKEVFVVGNFAEGLPSNSSRYVSQMYDQAREIEQAYASYQQAVKAGDYNKALEIYESQKEDIAAYKSIEAVKRQEAEITSRINKIEANPAMPADTKRRLIDMLSRQRDQIARQLVKAS